LDNESIKQALVLDAAWKSRSQQVWLALMELAVCGDLSSSRMGTLSRVRKRTLEVGEKLKSLTGNRDWIPHPREQLKNALASALHLNDSLRELTRIAGDLDNGADLGAFGANLAEMQHLVQSLTPFEQHWARLLDSQYRDEQD
jgi:hypothetical protein